MARRLSMIRDFHLADVLTLANSACGMGAILAVLAHLESGRQDLFFLAAGLGPVALLCDFLDGWVARKRGKHSLMGRQLDSLADVISFGVAPAVLGWASGLRGGWDCLILTYFVACGVSRLARYNVTAETLSEGADKVPYFEGAPIPTSLVLTAVLAFLAWTGHPDWPGAVVVGPCRLHFLSLLFFAHGSLMISKTIRIPKP